LILRECRQVTVTGIKELAQFKHLRSLDLGRCPNVTDAGVKELAQCKQLEELNISSCDNVTDEGIGFLANCKNLRLLRIYDTMVTEKGRATLKKALPGLEIRY
jgi:hypothetical protein